MNTDTPPNSKINNHSINRRTALKTALAAGSVAITGCLSGSDGGGTEFRVAAPWEATIDPLDGGLQTRRLGITEALVGVDYEANPAPELATEWTSHDSGQRWRFSLREDVTFHDGEPFDAAAAVKSLRRTVDSPVFTGIPVDTVEASGSHSIEVTTTAPFAPLPAHLARSQAAILSPGAYDDGTVTAPIGTGPLKVDSWESNTQIRTVRNDEYYGTVPAVESVRYETITDDQTRRLSLESGEIEMARILPVDKVDALRSTDDIDVHTYQLSRCRFLVFDTQSPPFDDARVRRALNYAVDKQVLIDSVLGGVGTPAVGPFPESVTEWHNSALEEYVHNPDRARSLLAEAGWVSEGNDGVRSREGDELSIEIMTYRARPRLAVIAEVLQSQLGNVGIDVDISVFEYPTMTERAEQNGFDCYLMAMSTLLYPDPDRLSNLYHSEESILKHGYDNPEVDTLLEEARTTFDRATRKRKYDRVQSVTHRDVPVSFLTYYTNVVALQSNTDGYRPHPTEVDYGIESITVGDN
ncbi:ABC transporter substrate-binding protein [Halococcus sp. IIIV-5B]|uniref:ABC transporter substrate-binding protein n=1 Tax=Halococcus sp. IIIV-5B TaxID=2321230 RepID=UPI000E725439|nr:ABC transporter substrate-binding protein [Halococcus sp. IIIV-5B]RJT07417.1 ABC transporter substrate-binding protein [Halococcus sp. IIIV-5B]